MEQDAGNDRNTFPLEPESLNLEWLNAALEEGGLPRANAFETEVIGVGEGLMGQLARIHLQYPEGDAGPETIVAKFASAHENTREMARAQGYYQRELGFFRDIGNDAGIPTARCYFARERADTNQFVLLLEDLAPARASDQIEGTNAADSEWVIDTIAELHARWWNSEKLAALDWTTPLTNTMSAAEGKAMIEASIAQKEASGSFDAYPEMKRLMHMLPPLFAMEPPAPSPFTLCHGDLRSDNLLVPCEAGGQRALIDWQLAGVGQPASDVARWLTQSVTVEQRRATEQALLKRYHDRLVELGVRNYSYKAFLNDYKLNLVVLLLMFSMSMDDIDQSADRAGPLLDSMFRRLDAALVDWKVAQILQVLPYMIPFLKLRVWFSKHFRRT